VFTETIIDQSPLWLLYVITVWWLLIGCELGFRVGRRSKARWPESGKVSSAPIMGSILGLLAFMLAFTFGMSSTRFDTRKQLVLEEASAILVAHQRAQTLPEPHRSECSGLLREYAAQRLALPTVKTVEELQGIVVRAERIQDALWAQATIMGERPNMNLTGFVQSLTILTDLQIKRLRAAVWNRIPGVIVLALYGIAFLALMALGFNSGMNEHRPGIPAIVLALAFSSVIVLIVDLERPRQQLFTVSQEPMADVARRIQPAKQP
jgi:hypothetical protein